MLARGLHVEIFTSRFLISATLFARKMGHARRRALSESDHDLGACAGGDMVYNVRQMTGKSGCSWSFLGRVLMKTQLEGKSLSWFMSSTLFYF